MKKYVQFILITGCALFAAVSFLYLTMRNRDILGEYYAKSSINIEIDSAFARNIALSIETSPNPCSYWLSPTSMPDSESGRVIMHVSVPLKRPYWNPAVQIPESGAADIMEHIDSVVMFVSNKVFYFTGDEARNFKQGRKDGYLLLYIPNIFYTKSFLFKNWSNYYGDVNLCIKALTAFFLYPIRYAPVWCAFIVLCLLLGKEKFTQAFNYVAKHKKSFVCVTLLLILAAGFILRWNGFVRHSGWTDEIYSATVTGNPRLPLLAVFGDSGNPPFYFLLLRFWFKIFGWSETSGTMLSVLLGTFASLTLFFFVKPFWGNKTALAAAFFAMISGFVIGYSQEMRAYILKIFLVPLIGLAFLRYTKKASVKKALLYILPSVCIVNAHYYGILFIIANYIFYLAAMLKRRQLTFRKWLAFSLVNAVIAASFLPFFLYMLIYRNYDFSRDFAPRIGHTFLALIIVMCGAGCFANKKELSNFKKRLKIFERRDFLFAAYIVLTPVFIYLLSYSISYVKPMIEFRYLWPVCTPFIFCFMGVCVSATAAEKSLSFLAPLLLYMGAVSLNGIVPDIPSGGTEGSKEAHAYITLDSAAHRDKNPAMLENTPEIASYYDTEVLPAYEENGDYDILYVYNDIFHMHENEMYARMRERNIDETNILKICFDYDYPRADGGVIIKKYLPSTKGKQGAGM